MKPANFAPIYACLYPQLAEIARFHGYALACHGSLARDFDLVCIPWIEDPSDPQTVVDEMKHKFSIQEVGGPPSLREHGRIIYSLSLSFGECFVDLSFMPTNKNQRLLMDILVAASHHEGAFEEQRPRWEPLVVEELNRRMQE